jgi:hypothetical protein
MPIDWKNPEDIILAELEPAEELLWAGRPKQGLIFRRTELMMLVFAVVIFGPTLLAMFPGAGNNVGQPFPPFLLLGAPHLVFMFAYLFGRPIYDACSRSRCAYGVTTERAVMVSGLFGRRVRSLELDAMVDAKLLRPWRGEGGVIRFGHNAATTDVIAFGPRRIMPNAAIDYFELDRGAQEVYRLIDAALRKQGRRLRQKGVVATKSSTDQPTVWEHANEVIEPELGSNELLLWSGRPRQGFSLRWSHIVFTLLAFLWMQSFMLLGGGGANFGVFVLWFLLGMKALSVVAEVTRSVYDARRRSRTVYGVTTHRLLSVAAGSGGQVRSLALNEVANLLLSERSEMAGTIVVGPDLPVNESQQRAAITNGDPPGMLHFDLSQDVRLLYRLIRRARRPVETVSG